MGSETSLPQETAQVPTVLEERPAFPILVRCAATALMAALLVQGAGLVPEVRWGEQTASSLAMGGLLIVLLGWTYYWIMASRFRLTDVALEQSWIWPKRVLLSEITQAKLVRVPRLEWMVAPRLVLRTRGLGVHVLYCSDARVLERVLALGRPTRT